uniref:Uncharacterized protein n=1 Tax=Cupriavidus taiwanensis TaxID=164546 RepID=A0A375HES4_9BURK|nr:protein of unknown function [Cupriavidus taiwanensis]
MRFNNFGFMCSPSNMRPSLDCYCAMPRCLGRDDGTLMRDSYHQHSLVETSVEQAVLQILDNF